MHLRFCATVPVSLLLAVPSATRKRRLVSLPSLECRCRVGIDGELMDAAAVGVMRGLQQGGAVGIEGEGAITGTVDEGYVRHAVTSWGHPIDAIGTIIIEIELIVPLAPAAATGDGEAGVEIGVADEMSVPVT